MTVAAPVPRKKDRPSREEILLARRSRRLRFSFFVASIAWPAVVALRLAMLRPESPIAAVFDHVYLLVPGIVAGLAAGRRMWPFYLPALIVVCAPMAILPTFFAIVLTGGLVLALGYGWRLATGRSVSTPPREADAPRAVGCAQTTNPKLPWKRHETIAGASPTGREMPKSRWR